MWCALTHWPSLQNFFFCLPLFFSSCLCPLCLFWFIITLIHHVAAKTHFQTYCHYVIEYVIIIHLHVLFFLVPVFLLITFPLSVSAIQDHLCPVYSRGPIHSASSVHNYRLFHLSTGTSSGWICLCSTRVHSHCTTWTGTGSTTDYRSVLLWTKCTS